MSSLDPERLKSLLLERGEPKELFRVNLAHHTEPYITRGFFGELVFTDTAVCFVPRAMYRVLWRMFKRPMMGITFSYLPGALLMALLFGLAGYTRSVRGFYLGSLAGAVASLFITTLVIVAINRKYSFEKALGRAKAAALETGGKPVEEETISLIFWRDKLEGIFYDESEETLKIAGPGGRVIFEFNVPLEEYNRRKADIEGYLPAGQTE